MMKYYPLCIVKNRSKNLGKNIQTVGYNVAHTVVILQRSPESVPEPTGAGV